MHQVRLLLLTAIAAVTFPVIASAQTAGTFRDVQFRSIDFEAQTVELHNFGATTWALDGWRFCTHDELDGFDYTSSAGLNGQSLDAGESLFIHWNDDASGLGAINVSSLGGAWIDDLTVNATGQAASLGLYDGTTGFGSSDGIADHIQYSFGGLDASFNGRRTVATAADLWGDTTDWISVGTDSTSILLTDAPFPGAAATHSSGSFAVTSAVPEPTTFTLLAVGAAGIATRRRRK